MPEPRQIAAILHEQFAAVGSPLRLDASRVQLGAWLAMNQAAARAGRPQPTGDVLLGVGCQREADAMVNAAKLLPAGGPFAVLYSPPPMDAVAVVPLAQIEAHGRDALAQGRHDPARPYIFEIGERMYCEREATRLRRIRAGYRSQEVHP